MFTLGLIVGAGFGVAFGVAIANRTRPAPTPTPPLPPVFTEQITLVPRHSNIRLVPAVQPSVPLYDWDQSA